MLNLNPELVDQDKIRKGKRKRLLKYVSAPCLLLLLASIFVLRVGIFNIVYSLSYNNENFEVADSMTDAQSIGNIIMPFLKYYNSGVAKIKREQFEEAEAAFRASLKENPPADVMCQINTNLSLSIEMQADKAYISERYDDALVLYGKAQSALYANGCASKYSGEGKDNKAIEAKERIDTKLAKTMNKINSRKEDEGGGQGQEAGYSMNDDQKQRLNNRREAQNEVNWQLQNAIRGSKSYGCNNPERGLREICW